MGHKSAVPQIGDRVGDEPVVEFLVIVDFQAAGHPGDVDMADFIDIVAKRSGDVPIRDLRVVNIIQNFHAR